MKKRDHYLHSLYYNLVPNSLKSKLKDEKIKWVGKPERIPYLFLSLILSISGMYLLLFFSFVILSAYSAGLPLLLTISALIVLVFANGMIIIPLFSKFKTWHKMIYIVTANKVVLKDGIYEGNREYEISSLSKMRVDNSGFVDNLFDLGTIEMNFKESEETFEHIKEFKDVSKLLKKSV